MRLRPLSRFATAALLAGLLALVPAAAAHGPEDVDFGDGSISGLWEDDARTQAGFDNLHYEFGTCGELANELTCAWSVEVVLYSNPKDGCPPVAGSATVVWSSGERSGNGSVDSGPRTVALPPCQGNQLTVAYEYRKTYGPWEGEEPQPWLPTGGGGSFALLPVGVVDTEIRNIVESSPPARPDPMPVPPPALRASPDCRSLFAGGTRYVFAFKGIGCRKAARIASSTRFGDATPNGYRCALKPGGGGRCVREGNPGRFLEWHPPRQRAAKNA